MPLRVLSDIDLLITERRIANYKPRKAEFVDKLVPIHDSIRRIKAAYAITAYPHCTTYKNMVSVQLQIHRRTLADEGAPQDFGARVSVEDVREIRRHPEHIRYTLLAAYCVQREEEIIDTLIELLINLIHRIEKRVERTVDRQVLRYVKRIRGKPRLLYEVAQASVQRPEGTVKDVIYPVAPEHTLRCLVEEFRLGGSYEQKVQVLMRGSYSNHYRRMVPLVSQGADLLRNQYCS